MNEKTIERLKELIRYAANSVVVLATKLSCMWVLDHYLNALVAYLIVHVIVFFCSYWIHSRFSFGAELSWPRMARYLRAVIVIKVLDYLIFSVAFVYFHIEALWSVFGATVIIGLVRFALARSALKGALAE